MATVRRPASVLGGPAKCSSPINSGTDLGHPRLPCATNRPDHAAERPARRSEDRTCRRARSWPYSEGRQPRPARPPSAGVGIACSSTCSREAPLMTTGHARDTTAQSRTQRARTPSGHELAVRRMPSELLFHGGDDGTRTHDPLRAKLGQPHPPDADGRRVQGRRGAV